VIAATFAQASFSSWADAAGVIIKTKVIIAVHKFDLNILISLNSQVYTLPLFYCKVFGFGAGAAKDGFFSPPYGGFYYHSVQVV
jgi:hypothetical protein